MAKCYIICVTDASDMRTDEFTIISSSLSKERAIEEIERYNSMAKEEWNISDKYFISEVDILE